MSPAPFQKNTSVTPGMYISGVIVYVVFVEQRSGFSCGVVWIVE